MNGNNTIIREQTDVTQSFDLQIPGGTSFEVKASQGQYSFCLSEDVLTEIQKAKNARYPLYIPPKLLFNLGYYTSLNNPQDLKPNKEKRLGIVQKQLRNFYNVFPLKYLQLFWDNSFKVTLQSGITFYSYYEDICVLRSIISLDGDVIYQVRRDFIQNSNFEATTSAHHWIVNHLLSRLRTNMDLLAWELTLLFPAFYSAWHLSQLLLNQQLLWLLISVLVFSTGVVLWLIFAVFHYWLVNQLQKRFSIHFNNLNYGVSLLAWLPVNLITFFNDEVQTSQLSLETLIHAFLHVVYLQFVLPLLLIIVSKCILLLILPQVLRRFRQWVFS